MDKFQFPTSDGAEEVANALGISVDEILKFDQDWEYVFPSLSDLSLYESIYAADQTSDLAKKVLGCFIFQCLEDHMSLGGEKSIVRSSLSQLACNYDIHQHEFLYWSQADDPYYDEHPEDGFHIMLVVREFLEENDFK